MEALSMLFLLPLPDFTSIPDGEKLCANAAFKVGNAFISVSMRTYYKKYLTVGSEQNKKFLQRYKDCHQEE